MCLLNLVPAIIAVTAEVIAAATVAITALRSVSTGL